MCAGCGEPIPAHVPKYMRWCSDRCFRAEDGDDRLPEPEWEDADTETPEDLHDGGYYDAPPEPETEE
jgi:hypothetical protein